MRHLRFNHVFFGLMALAGVSAFVLPQSLTNPGRSVLQGAFAPVARPTRVVAGWAHDRFARPDPVDDARAGEAPRSQEQLRAENYQLKLLVSNLTFELDKLRELNAQRESVGADIRPFCTPFAVLGTDAGMRASLSIQATSLDGVAVAMPVLAGGELVGRIDRVGVGGAQVQLITDSGFRVTAGFVRFVEKGGRREPVTIAAPPALAEGTGKGEMQISKLSMRQVEEAGLRQGDWVVLADDDTPWRGVRGRYLGQIASITPRRDAPLHADIRVQPRVNLLQLREVMVLTGRNNDGGAGSAKGS